jgi:hypothetical protein
MEVWWVYLQWSSAGGSRAAGLEAGSATGGVLTVDLKADVYQEETLTGLNWAPYRYNKQTQAWEAYPSIEYWDALGEELKDKFYQLYPDDPPETNLGRVTVARSYSFALINGVASTFRCSPTDLLCAISKGSSASDANLIKAKFALGTGANTVVQKIVTDIIEAFQSVFGQQPRPQGFKGWLYSLGAQLMSGKTFYKDSRGGALAGGIVIGAALVALITTVVVACHMDINSAQAIAVVLRGVIFVLGLVALGFMIANLFK